MVAKSTPSLDDLRAQARRTFRYWPIYLMLRLREVEQHLTPAQRAELGSVLSEREGEPTRTASVPERVQPDPRVNLLIEYGLLPADVQIPDSLPSLPEQPDITACTFRCEAADEAFLLMSDVQMEGELMRLTLLRTNATGQADVERAGEIFATIQQEVSPNVALEVAQVWALLHGSRSLPWYPIISRAAGPDAAVPAIPTPTLTVLPPRRRGRGQFRMPG